MSNIIGFSEDGKYVAFERYGNYDGSGFPYSEIFIINVEKNDYAVRPLHLQDEGSRENGEPALLRHVRDRNYKRAMALFKRFGIVRANKPTRIPEKKISKSGKKMEVPFNGKVYILVLKETELKRSCYEYGNARIFELDLRIKKRIIVLQKDSALPGSRGCVLGYRISEAFIYKNKIVVFIEYSTPGFEGPDVRQIMVTGTIE